MAPNSWNLEYPIREFVKVPLRMMQDQLRAFLHTEQWLHIDVPHYSPVYH